MRFRQDIEMCLCMSVSVSERYIVRHEPMNWNHIAKLCVLSARFFSSALSSRLTIFVVKWLHYRFVTIIDLHRFNLRSHRKIAYFCSFFFIQFTLLSRTFSFWLLSDPFEKSTNQLDEKKHIHQKLNTKWKFRWI